MSFSLSVSKPNQQIYGNKTPAQTIFSLVKDPGLRPSQKALHRGKAAHYSHSKSPYKELALTFIRREEGITPWDVNFDHLFTDLWNEAFSDDIETIWDLPEETRRLLWDIVPDGTEHRIGGYPYFTQQDPREEDSPFTELLLQMNSDGDYIMWGTMGVANFFIRKEDLKEKNFEEVLYNWDC